MVLLVVLLAAPSVYLFLKFPPLRRDSDGFYQIYARPGELTILHWPPLYCFLARIPVADCRRTTTNLDHDGRTPCRGWSPVSLPA
jgi:hypothetical protein